MESDKPILVLIKEYISEQDTKPYIQKYNLWLLQRFVNWMVKNKIDVRNPRRADIISYKNSLITEDKTPCTVNTYLAPVRKLFQWFEINKIYENIAAGIKTTKDRRDFRKDYLNPEQANQLLNSIPKNSLVGLRNFAMIKLMLIYALRRVEILRLTVDDLKNDSGEIVLYIHRKGRDYKEPLKLLPDVFEPIEEYLIARSKYLPGYPLFANHSPHPRNTISATMYSRILKNYLKQISDSKKLTCHSLRHSTAINLLKSGKSIFDVQQLLSHTSTKTTELYLAAIKAETKFNNPVTPDIINLYKNALKTPNKVQISVE